MAFFWCLKCKQKTPVETFQSFHLAWNKMPPKPVQWVWEHSPWPCADTGLSDDGREGCTGHSDAWGEDCRRARVPGTVCSVFAVIPSAAGTGVAVPVSFQEPHVVHRWLFLKSHRYTALAVCHVIDHSEATVLPLFAYLLIQFLNW